ncbi:MAG: polynucleotide adenylyltransferase PcnB [Gammaproteobacteria bacterium]|nr:polynucleotide adenylyltransferase PcnB [Gammaproteobacteria bacterium]
MAKNAPPPPAPAPAAPRAKSPAAPRSAPAPARGAPRIYTRSEHAISRKLISPNALKVLYRLDGAGFRACLVGGGVRDLLLGREPKDFDIATDARPEQIRELFRNCRLIGRRFRLAHVRFGNEIIEVATFRAAHEEDDGGAAEMTDDGRILRDNVYGDIEDDVWRRDFTVNGLYYDIHDFSVIDYVGGVADLERGVLRVIGDPEQRYREDPVRMLRAIRFAVKLGFKLDDACAAPLPRLAALLDDISPARLFDETLKLFHGGYALQTFEALRHHHLFEHLFPLTEIALSHEHEGFPATLVGRALDNTDRRLAEGKSVTPAFLLAALLWDAVEERRQALEEQGLAPQDATLQAADDVIARQVARLAIPKRFTLSARDIWALQPRLTGLSPKRARRVFENPRFRAAYDFFLLRAEAGDADADTAEWWTEFQDADDAGREAMLGALEEVPSGDRPRRRRRRKRH